jgi:hypothetical protein
MKMPIDVAIIGAGPYGLSLAAHLHARRIEFRIFGKPMGYWKGNMPPGMLLKSYPWASNLYNPELQFTIKQFFAEQDMPYHDSLLALTLENFIAYGETFQRRFVPNVEQKMLIALEQTPQGFLATFHDNEMVCARVLVLAVGLHAFKHVPRAIDLPAEVLSHSSDYGPLGGLRGKQVAVLGSGASGTDLAALLHEQGTAVSLVARDDEVRFACLPRLRSLLERLVEPNCGIGSGWVLKACSDAPRVIHMLPEHQRLRLAKLPGPLGGAFMKRRVIGEVPLFLARSVEAAELRGNKVHLRVVKRDGAKEMLEADHVIAATGYKIDISKLPFLDARLQSRIRCVEGAPVLSTKYESSVSGLHFIGPVAASSFGSVARFIFGASYPSRHLARYLSRMVGRRSTPASEATRVVSPVFR